MASTILGREVGHVYNGDSGKCCCGCAGTHKYAKSQREAQSERRGYEVEDDEISDRSIAITCGKINRAMENGDGVEFYGDFIAIEDRCGGRMNVAYFTKEG